MQGANQMGGQKRANTQKPSSAPSKNRIRSQSPINIDQQPGGTSGNGTQSYPKQKNMITGPMYQGSGTQKMIGNSGGFSGMMTQGQSMQSAGGSGVRQ